MVYVDDLFFLGPHETSNKIFKQIQQLLLVLVLVLLLLLLLLLL